MTCSDLCWFLLVAAVHKDSRLGDILLNCSFCEVAFICQFIFSHYCQCKYKLILQQCFTSFLDLNQQLSVDILVTIW